jgi:signal transduction histidine kinase
VSKETKQKKTVSKSLQFGRLAINLINNMPLGVIIFDINLAITDSNQYAVKILHSDRNIAQALTAGASPESKINWQKDLAEALTSPKPRTFENISYSKNGVNCLLQIICTPLTDEKTGAQIGGILLIEDVTTKMAMEKDLASAERLAAVGKLAARVAHELNNPLDGILRYLNLALRLSEQNENPQVSHYLQESRKGLLRMVQIISELLEFSRSTYSSFEDADINKIVEDAVKAMESLAENNQVTVIRNYAPDMPNIRSGNLFQVFCNLIKNAVDAMADGGTLEITTRCDSHNAIMEFADTGTGIPQPVLKKIFEPFYTTKPAGKGTGLGLAICKDIIERYNGQILAANRQEAGTVFTVTIPLELTSRCR